MKRFPAASFTLLTVALAVAGFAADVADARALFEADKDVEAQRAFEQLAGSAGAGAEVYYYLGELALRRDDAQVAMGYFQRACAAAPAVSLYQQRLGDAFGLAAQKASIFSQIGLAKKCLAAYQRAVSLDANNVDARYCLFEYYRHAPAIMGGGADKARAEAATIKRLDPVRGRLASASLLVAQGEYERARAELAESPVLDLATVGGTSAFLSDVAWKLAKVGWGRPARNHYWFDEEIHRVVALRLRGRLVTKALYAHSPSQYVFALDGRWRAFTASVGLCDGAHQQGSAIFTVRGDGRELFRSGMLRVGQSQKVSVDVTGVTMLELIAEGGEGHSHNSWAIWAEPLVRQ